MADIKLIIPFHSDPLQRVRINFWGGSDDSSLQRKQILW